MDGDFDPANLLPQRTSADCELVDMEWPLKSHRVDSRSAEPSVAFDWSADARSVESGNVGVLNPVSGINSDPSASPENGTEELDHRLDVQHLQNLETQAATEEQPRKQSVERSSLDSHANIDMLRQAGLRQLQYQAPIRMGRSSIHPALRDSIERDSLDYSRSPSGGSSPSSPQQPLHLSLIHI